jgi:hypothetical protein
MKSSSVSAFDILSGLPVTDVRSAPPALPDSTGLLQLTVNRGSAGTNIRHQR